MTLPTLPNPKWEDPISTVLDAAAAVDKGGGQVGLPITGHSFQANQIITIAGSVNYNGDFKIESKTTNEIVITATYVAETFSGAETIVFGKQIILKEDFKAIETAITSVNSGNVGVGASMITWASVASLKVLAMADSPVKLYLSGFPNVFDFSKTVGETLTDNKQRTNVSDVTFDFAVGTTLWGSEKSSQLYALFAIAADVDTTFTLKAMPFGTVKSDTANVISFGTHLTPATGIGYGFTTDEMVGGLIYVLSGTSRGLLRTITANNNDSTTGGTVTYSGDDLGMSAGDVFIILPPGINFKYLGCFFNNSSGNIVTTSLFDSRSVTIGAADTYFWIILSPVTSILAEYCGGAGGGSGGFRGGHGYAMIRRIPVIPGELIKVIVGAASGGAGNFSRITTGGVDYDVLGGAVASGADGAGGPGIFPLGNGVIDASGQCGYATISW